MAEVTRAQYEVSLFADIAKADGAIPGMDQPPEFFEVFNFSEVIWETVPHPGGLKSKRFMSILHSVDPGHLCSIFFPEVIIRHLYIYKIMNIFRRNFVYNFKNLTTHFLQTPYMKPFAVGNTE